MRTDELDGQVSLFGPDSGSGRTSPAHSAAGGTLQRVKNGLERIFKRSSKRSSKLKNRTFMLLDLRAGAGNLLGACWEYDPPWLGTFGTLNTSECPKDVVESSLWQILQDTAPSRYSLSTTACLGILRRARCRGKPLPELLESALMMQAGLLPPKPLTDTVKAYHINQRNEGILCLNDQGGERMDVTVDKIATLRAQMNQHQPLVLTSHESALYENYGRDSRYTGPHKAAPTVTAAYGSGGNNTPLVQQALFSRQRVDLFQADETASTESARQRKDATDLVCQQISDKPEYWKHLIRRLTPLECERLQGFPDGWTDIPKASDAARYKALGNSVAIPCVEYLLQRVAMVILLDLEWDF